MEASLAKRRSTKPANESKKYPFPHKVLQAGARAAFNSMRCLIGEEKNARVKSFDKQPTFIQQKWREYVQGILNAAALENGARQ